MSRVGGNWMHNPNAAKKKPRTEKEVAALYDYINAVLAKPRVKNKLTVNPLATRPV